VKNTGANVTNVDSWWDAVYLSKDMTLNTATATLLGRYKHEGAIENTGRLQPGASYTGDANVTIPQKIGDSYYIYVVTDVDGNGNVYEEFGETNNIAAAHPISITLTPPPDFEVTSVSTPNTTAGSGQNINVQWTVINNGPGKPFESVWNDRIYLSASSSLNPDTAIVLGTFSNSVVLEAGKTYSRSENVKIPDGVEGTFYLHVKTDCDNQIFENLKEDNNSNYAPNQITITLSPWADLQVTEIRPLTAPVTAGQKVDITFTVTNKGNGSADGTWTVYDRENSSLLPNDVNTLVSDGDGGIWFGSYSRGLAHLYSDGTWDVYNTENSNLPDNYVNTLISDSNGGIWIGTGGGLAYLAADGTWIVYDTENSSLPDNYVDTLISDSSGGIWIGTGGGLAYLSAYGTWSVYDTENSSLPDNYINTLVSDSSGGIWIGTGGGLAYLSAYGTWSVYDTENSSLPHNYVNTLVLDANEGIWIGTNGGLAHLSFDKAIVKIYLNQAVYQIGDPLTLDITLNGTEPVDLYVLAFYPDGEFQSVVYPYYFSRINTIMPYKEAIELSGQQTLHILDKIIEAGQKTGVYTYYGIAVKAGLDPFKTENWLHSAFKTYNLK